MKYIQLLFISFFILGCTGSTNPSDDNHNFTGEWIMNRWNDLDQEREVSIEYKNDKLIFSTDNSNIFFEFIPDTMSDTFFYSFSERLRLEEITVWDEIELNLVGKDSIYGYWHQYDITFGSKDTVSRIFSGNRK